MTPSPANNCHLTLQWCPVLCSTTEPRNQRLTCNNPNIALRKPTSERKKAQKTRWKQNQPLHFCKAVDVFGLHWSCFVMFVFSFVCFCGLKLYGILLYMISIIILWCARFDEDNEYYDYHFIIILTVTMKLWAALRCCVLIGRGIVEEEKEEWMNSYRLIYKNRDFSCWVESPATVKDPAVLGPQPDAPPPTPCHPAAPGTSLQAVIRWQPKSLLHVHNPEAYV